MTWQHPYNYTQYLKLSNGNYKKSTTNCIFEFRRALLCLNYTPYGKNEVRIDKLRLFRSYYISKWPGKLYTTKLTSFCAYVHNGKCLDHCQLRLSLNEVESMRTDLVLFNRIQLLFRREMLKRFTACLGEVKTFMSIKDSKTVPAWGGRKTPFIMSLSTLNTTSQ